MAADADFNAEALVEEGLQLYSRGELDSALARWREVLAREPEHLRARDYLRYVEENRAALEESFRSARLQTEAAQAVQVAQAVAAQAAQAAQPARPEAAQDSGPEPRKHPSKENTAAILVPGAVAAEEDAPDQGSAGERRTAPMDVVEKAGPGPAANAPGSRLDILAGALAAVSTADSLVQPGEDIEIEVAVPPDPAPGSEAEPQARGAGQAAPEDPSFVRMADEIARTAQRISDEIPITVLPGTPAVAGAPSRSGLLDLKAKVAATKARLSREMPAAKRSEPEPASAEDEGAFEIPDWKSSFSEAESPADQPTSPVLMPPPRATPGPPPAEEPSISSRPTPSGGSLAVPTIPAPSDQLRARQMTPLRLIGGGGGGGPPTTDHDFEPLEATPVARLPQPARLLSMAKPGEDLLERLDGDADGALEELTRDNITPSSLARTPAKPKTPSPLETLAAQAPLYGDEDKPHTFVGIGPGATPAKQPTSPEPPRTGTGSLTPVRDAVEKLESLLESARQLHEQGTFEGSLWLCERVLAKDAGSTAARALLQKNQDMLLKQYRKQLGDQRAVPVVQIPQHEIVWHKLDHRAGFLLSRIDGQLSFEDLLDVSGMSEFEACRILSQLMSQGVIGPRR